MKENDKEIKQYQDDRWNRLTEEEREELRSGYKRCPKAHPFSVRHFGLHNISPESVIKTWEDLGENCDLEYFNKVRDIFTSMDTLMDNQQPVIPESVKNKMKATLIISKLIGLSYGGNLPFVNGETCWTIELSCDRDKWYYTPKEATLYVNWPDTTLLFHTKEQVVDFLSHDSNIKLLDDYYQMPCKGR